MANSPNDAPKFLIGSSIEHTIQSASCGQFLIKGRQSVARIISWESGITNQVKQRESSSGLYNRKVLDYVLMESPEFGNGGKLARLHSIRLGWQLIHPVTQGSGGRYGGINPGNGPLHNVGVPDPPH